MEHSSNY